MFNMTGDIMKCNMWMNVSKCLSLNYYSPCKLKHGSEWLLSDLTIEHTYTCTPIHTSEKKCNTQWIKGDFDVPAFGGQLRLKRGERRRDESWLLQLIKLFEPCELRAGLLVPVRDADWYISVISHSGVHAFFTTPPLVSHHLLCLWPLPLLICFPEFVFLSPPPLFPSLSIFLSSSLMWWCRVIWGSRLRGKGMGWEWIERVERKRQSREEREKQQQGGRRSCGDDDNPPPPGSL